MAETIERVFQLTICPIFDWHALVKREMKLGLVKKIDVDMNEAFCIFWVNCGI